MPDKDLPYCELWFAKNDKGIRVLLASDEEMEGIGDNVESRLVELDAEIADGKAKGTPTFALARLKDTICQQHQDLISGHKQRMPDAEGERWYFKPYSYYARMEAEEEFTTRDKDTGAPVRSEDRVRDALMVASYKSVSKFNRDENEWEGAESLTAATIRELSGIVALRLWVELRGWSDPTEADSFRSG